MEVLISVFNEGYEKVIDEDDKDFVGVKYNPDAQDDIKTVFERIKVNLIKEKIPIGTETYVSYPRLPSDDKDFKDEFIDPISLSVKNKVVLQKRLTGLISYYKGSKEEYMPRVTKDEVIRCEMSDYVLSMYTKERNREIKGEQGKDKDKGDNYAAVEQFAKMKNPSSYRFRSRALCNFAFPDGIERPFPGTFAEEEEEVVQVEDIDMGEAATVVEEDLAAQELVAAEEATIPDPDLEGEDVEANEAEAVGEGEKEEKEDAKRVEEAGLEEAVKTVAAAEGVAVTEGGDYQEGGEGTDDEEEKKPTIPVQKVPVKRVRPKVAPAAFVAQPIAPKPAAEDADAASAATAIAAAIEEKKKANAPVTRVPRRKPQVAVAAPVPVVAEEAAELESKAEAVEEAEQEPTVRRVLSYQEQIKKAMDTLGANRDTYLKLDAAAPEGRIAQYSTKLDQMIRRINVSKGSNLVYSQFKTVEGLGVLREGLKANGFVEIEIEGGEWVPRALRTGGENKLQFSKATIESLRKGPDSGEKRFMFLTGEGLREKRNLLLNIFNGVFDKMSMDMRKVIEESGYGERKNKYGEICWVFGITGAGAEGISLKCCRSVHIMEPYWNKVRSDQVKGRAIRICSHQDLPFKEREVEIYTYYTVFSADQKNMNKIDVTIRQTDEDETSDEKVYNVGLKKDKINQELLDLMKETAMDCGLNAADNDGVQCFVVDGKPDQYLFDPNLQVDKILTSIEIKEVKEAPEGAIAKELGSRAAPKAQVEQITVMKWKGTEYLLGPKKGSGGLVFELFEMVDDKLTKPLGEISINPGTGTFKGSKPIMKI